MRAFMAEYRVWHREHAERSQAQFREVNERSLAVQERQAAALESIAESLAKHTAQMEEVLNHLARQT